MPEDGSDFVESVGSFQDINEVKNHHRGAAEPAEIQPGMLHSRSTDNRLIHRTNGQSYLIFQGEPVCVNNEVVCVNNQVVVILPV